MLTVILKILSILGVILLVLLGALLSAILLVLFVPVTYRVQADRQEAVPEGNSDKTGRTASSPLLHIAVKADWLFGALRVRFLYPDPGTVRVKALCFTLFDSGAGQETAETAKKHRKASGPQKGSMQEKSAERAEEETGQTKSSVRKETETKSGGKSRIKQNPIQKIWYTIQRLCAKIKALWENFAYYKEILLCEDTRGLAQHALMRIGKVLKSIRPRKLRADIRFGTGSPDTTGYAFGIYGMLCSRLGERVILTPDFERAVLAGELDAAGHITVFQLLRHGLILITDRRLRELVDKLRRT